MDRIDKKFERGSMGFPTTYTEYDDTQDSGSSRDKLAFRLFGAYEIPKTGGIGLWRDRGAHRL